MNRNTNIKQTLYEGLNAPKIDPDNIPSGDLNACIKDVVLKSVPNRKVTICVGDRICFTDIELDNQTSWGIVSGIYQPSTGEIFVLTKRFGEKNCLVKLNNVVLTQKHNSPLWEGLNLPKKKYQDKIEGNYPGGNGMLTQYWNNGKIKVRHRTYSSGAWFKYTYDENGNPIYYEYSDGYWSKREYDENGNEIYYEDSDGEIRDNRPQNINESLNLVSKKKYPQKIVGNYPNGEGSLTQYWDNGKMKFWRRTFDDGSWVNRDYNEKGDEIYYENYYGYWEKREYDENGNEIYFENSLGEIRDDRPQNINEGLNLVSKKKVIKKTTMESVFNKLTTVFNFDYQDGGENSLIGTVRFTKTFEVDMAFYDDYTNIITFIPLFWDGEEWYEEETYALTLEHTHSDNTEYIYNVIRDEIMFIYENETGKPFFLSEGLNLVKKKYREKIVGDYPNGYGTLIQYWDNGKMKFIHNTWADGRWRKTAYNKYGQNIFFAESEGYWAKWEYDENGNEIYFEDSDGVTYDNRPQNINEGLNLVSKKKYQDKIEGNYPDGDGRLTQYWNNGNIKFTHRTYSNGTWWKETYNENGDEIYFENYYGYWEKREYDENGNEIYFENSLGEIRDDRPQNINEGLNLVKKKYERITNYMSGISKQLISADWDERYEIAQQQNNSNAIKDLLTVVFKDRNVMVRVADNFVWSNGSNGFANFSNLDHYITDIGYRCFADDPELFTDVDRLKAHILYAYASSGDNLSRGMRFSDRIYDPKNNFVW